MMRLLMRQFVSMGENPYKASDFQIRVAERNEVSQLVTV